MPSFLSCSEAILSGSSPSRTYPFLIQSSILVSFTRLFPIGDPPKSYKVLKSFFTVLGNEMELPNNRPRYPLRYPTSSASGAISLYFSIKAPIEADRQGAIPPAVKKAIFI